MKNLNIKNASQDDITVFETIKGGDKTSSEALAILINHYKNTVTHTTVSGNPELDEKLEAVTQQLTESQNEVATLTTKVAELETNQQKPITDPDFIVTPTPKIAEAIEIIKPGFYKKGFTKNTDPEAYRNELVKFALRYLAENEFKKYLLV